MKTRKLIGQRIVAVTQERFWNDNLKTMSNRVKYIELENGVALAPYVEETEGEYAVDFYVYPREHKDVSDE